MGIGTGSCEQIKPPIAVDHRWNETNCVTHLRRGSCPVAPRATMHSRRMLTPTCSSPIVLTHLERCTKAVRSIVPAHFYRKLYRACIVTTKHTVMFRYIYADSVL